LTQLLTQYLLHIHSGYYLQPQELSWFTGFWWLGTRKLICAFYKWDWESEQREALLRSHLLAWQISHGQDKIAYHNGKQQQKYGQVYFYRQVV